MEPEGKAGPSPSGTSALSGGDQFFGRMNDPSGCAFVRGPCGDAMEFYLYIRDNIIREARYCTEGCASTRFYGRAVAERAEGKAVLEALAINPKELLDSQRPPPEEMRHCAILAVSALYRAIADFLLKP